MVCCVLVMLLGVLFCFFFFKQKTAYEMRISDWSSDVCSSDLPTVMRILLVEDELEMASWLVRALAQSGFTPDHAPDARSAEALMAANEYDAIVMDLRLPDKHGLVVLRDKIERAHV